MSSLPKAATVLLDQLIDIVRTGNVRIDSERFSTHGADLLDRVLGNRCAADVIHDDGGAGFRKCECYGLTDPGPGSRNDGYFVL